MKFALNGALYPRLQAGDVERGGEDRAGRSRGRVPRLHERHGVGEVSCRQASTGTHGRGGTRNESHSLGIWPAHRSSSGRRRRGRSQATARSATPPRSPTDFIEVTASPDGNWAQARATRYVLADKLADRVMKAAKVEAFERLADSDRGRCCSDSQCSHPLRSAWATVFDVPLLAGDHVTDEDGTGFVHTAPGHGREDFDIWMENAARLKARGIDTDHPLHRRRRRALHQGRAGLRGQARHRRQGQQGRRQRRRHQGAGRRRHDHRARPAQAPVPALLALQEAGDLPQHAAVVHRHGQAHEDAGPRRQSDAARGRAAGHRRDRVRAGIRAEPAARHGGVQARLGDLAPARVGHAHHRVPAQGDGRGDPVGQLRQVGRADGAHPRRHDARRAPTPGSRPARASASSQASSTTPPTGSR